MANTDTIAAIVSARARASDAIFRVMMGFLIDDANQPPAGGIGCRFVWRSRSFATAPEMIGEAETAAVGD